MKNILLTSTLLIFAPFVFVFGLILVLFSYNQNLQLRTSQAVTYVPLESTQNVLAATVYADTGGESDEKTEKVRLFLSRYNSPLVPYASDIVGAAEQYSLDHRLIPAIAMQESGLCKTIPKDSYNCWGFGIYGGKVTRFTDYKEGIYTVTKALAIRFRNQGLVTPEEIMTIYTPNSNGSWAIAVNHFMDQIQ